jgi:predicted kinase
MLQGRSPFPEGSLVLLVGPPAAGKTTFAARLVAAGVVEAGGVLSSDELRRVLTGSEADTSRDRNVFSALRARLRERLTAGRTTVIDATNLGRPRRQRYAAMAAAAGRPVVAVRFDVPIPELLARNSKRDREVPPGAVVGMARDMARESRMEELRLDGCDVVLEARDIEVIPR